MKAFHRKIVSAALLLLSAFSIQHSELLFAQAKTTVTDTIHNADGSLPNGTLVATNLTPFTSADSFVIVAGSKVTAAITNGLFSIQLVPNAGSNPSGTSYAVNYYTPGLTLSETWIVPSSAQPVNLAAVRTLTPPLPAVMLAMSQINPPSPCTASQFAQWSGTQWQCAAGGGGGGATFQVNGTNTSSQTTLNLQNSAATNGLTLTHTNTSGGNVQLGLSGTLTVPGGGTGLGTLTAHSLYVGNGTSNPNPVATGNSGQVLISNGASADPTFQDPIVSYGYVNLLNAAAATSTQTSSTVRVSTFGGFGTLYVTLGSLSGTFTSCTLQLKNADSLGNLISNGSAFALTMSNGTTTFAVPATAALQTTAQLQGVYACSAYGSAGTISVDYVPGIATAVVNTPSVAQSGTWTVQPGNTANTTAWLVTGTGGTFPTSPPSNASTNVMQFGGTNISTGTGASGAGIPRVTVSNDSNVLATESGTWTVQPGNTQNTTPWLVNVSAALPTGSNTIGAISNAGFNVTGSLPAGSNTIGSIKVTDGTNTLSIDPCSAALPTFVNINTTANVQLIAGAASKQTYICGYVVWPIGAAESLALVEGTGTTCGTGTAGIGGGSTAATGATVAANGGWVDEGNGHTVLRTATAADNVCLLVSSTAQVSGKISYVQQ